jgi:hypothetical protein
MSAPDSSDHLPLLVEMLTTFSSGLPTRAHLTLRPPTCVLLLAADNSIPIGLRRSSIQGHLHKCWCQSAKVQVLAGALLSSCIFTADCPIRALALHDLRVHDTVRCFERRALQDDAPLFLFDYHASALRASKL